MNSKKSQKISPADEKAWKILRALKKLRDDEGEGWSEEWSLYNQAFETAQMAAGLFFKEEDRER